MSTIGLAAHWGESRNGRLEEKERVVGLSFGAQSVIKILVIGLASALRLKGLLSTCCRFHYLQFSSELLLLELAFGLMLFYLACTGILPPQPHTSHY